MSDRTAGLLYIGAMVLLSFAFQYQMKILASEVAPVLSRTGDVTAKLLQLLHRPALWRLLGLLAVAVVLFALWLLALTKLELSVALPLASITVVVNAVGIGMLSGEALSPLRIGGVVVVAAGIAMVYKS
jgi:multidrug transporter EmrE-like cation transporter